MASTEVAPGKLRPRPLSPHILIYKITITMVMSIVHRICGAALYVGVLLLAWFLIAASTDAAAFGIFSAFIQSFIGQLCAVRLHRLRSSSTCSAASAISSGTPATAWRRRPAIIWPGARRSAASGWLS